MPGLSLDSLVFLATQSNITDTYIRPPSTVAFFHRKQLEGISLCDISVVFKFMDVDPGLAQRIRRLPTARMAQEEAKRQVYRQRADWRDVNIATMDTVLEAKFSQHRSLRHLLEAPALAN
jgi:hypothetical protein